MGMFLPFREESFFVVRDWHTRYKTCDTVDPWALNTSSLSLWDDREHPQAFSNATSQVVSTMSPTPQLMKTNPLVYEMCQCQGQAKLCQVINL